MHFLKVTQVRIVPPDAEAAATKGRGTYVQAALGQRLEVTMENDDPIYPSSYRFVTGVHMAANYPIGSEWEVGPEAKPVPVTDTTSYVRPFHS